MSTAYSSAKQQYIGNGVTTEWGFDFPIQKHSELKVYLKRSEMPQVLLEEGVDYSFVTENTIAFPIKTGEAKLQAADVLALQRESVFESEYNFSNQQRLEPEEVMHADDNLERQIQELKRDSESAIKVLPTSNVDPNTFFEQVDRVYGSVDNIDTVANDKANVDAVAGSITNVNTVAGSIESVKTVANNIESVVVDATNISDIKTVAGSITNVNKTAGSIDNVNVVAPSISSVKTVAANISSVNTAASNMADIKAAPTAASNAAQSAANAANSATISANSAIWAEGTDAQVQALGGVHSSKVWAEQSTNANIALTNSPYTTNRILEIPQDIKLELNNGTLTLKAGSKVYVPNGKNADGSNKFDVLIVDVDKQITNSSNGKLFLIINSLSKNVASFTADRIYSGSEPPVGSANNILWYDTENNVIKNSVDKGVTWINKMGFPLCLYTAENTVITSIDQIFNGFGYIGSTVFALPGIKCLVGNGRNPDGSCITKIEASAKVSIYVMNGFLKNNKIVLFRGIVGTRQNLFFDEQFNMCYNTGASAHQPTAILGTFSTEATSPWNITEFNPLGVDSILNSNLSNLSAAGQAKFDAKANVSNTVTTDTTQTISGVKTFIGGTLKANTPLLLKQGNANEGGQIDFERSNNSVLKNNPFIDLFTNTIRFVGVNSNNTVNTTLRADLQNNQVFVPTPALTANDTQVATTAWVNTKVGGFANTNASNFTATGKQTVVGWGMPDYSAGVAKNRNTAYTAEMDGLLFVCFNMYQTAANANYMTINNVVVHGKQLGGNSGGGYFSVYPLSKNDNWTFSTTSSQGEIMFYPFKGVN